MEENITIHSLIKEILLDQVLLK